MRSKPRVTIAAVRAAYEVVEQFEIPDGYYELSKDDQRRVKEGAMRQALIAAYHADRPSPVDGELGS